MQTFQQYKLSLVRENETQVYNERFTNGDIIYDFCKNTLKITDSPVECIYVFGVDVHQNIICFAQIAQGSIDSCIASTASIFRFLLLSNAKYGFIVHNHPSGDYMPSVNDREITQKIIHAGNLMDINIVDHVIVTNDNYYSFYANERNLWE